MKASLLLLTALNLPIFLNGMKDDENMGLVGRWVNYFHKDVPEITQEIPIYKTFSEAFAANDYEGFKKFLENNPDLNLREKIDEEDNTWLHHAINQEKRNTARALLNTKGGFELCRIANKNRKTPADLAARNNCCSLFAYTAGASENK